MITAQVLSPLKRFSWFIFAPNTPVKTLRSSFNRNLHQVILSMNHKNRKESGDGMTFLVTVIYLNYAVIFIAVFAFSTLSVSVIFKQLDFQLYGVFIGLIALLSEV